MVWRQLPSLATRAARLCACVRACLFVKPFDHAPVFFDFFCSLLCPQIPPNPRNRLHRKRRAVEHLTLFLAFFLLLMLLLTAVSVLVPSYFCAEAYGRKSILLANNSVCGVTDAKTFRTGRVLFLVIAVPSGRPTVYTARAPCRWSFIFV